MAFPPPTPPRSLHLSSAFLCAHRMLDPNELIPHLAVADAGAVAASSLLMADAAHRVATVERLGRLGARSDGQAQSSSLSSAALAVDHSPPLECDPVVMMYRAMLALGGDLDATAAFLARLGDGQGRRGSSAGGIVVTPPPPPVHRGMSFRTLLLPPTTLPSISPSPGVPFSPRFL